MRLYIIIINKPVGGLALYFRKQISVKADRLVSSGRKYETMRKLHLCSVAITALQILLSRFHLHFTLKSKNIVLNNNVISLWVEIKLINSD